MPEGEHYSITELNNAYIYTNYNKSHIRDVKEPDSPNKFRINYTELKSDIEQIELKTTYHNRIDFNTLTPPETWQKTLLKVFDDLFETCNDPLQIKNNCEKVQLHVDLSQKTVCNQIIVDAKIESFDDFVNEIKEKGKDINFNFSSLDVEKLYNLACFEELKKQDEDEAKYNPSRSWGQLKAALNVWFNTRLGMDRSNYYPIIVNEMLKESSVLKSAINKSLKEFRKEYEIKVKAKKSKIEFQLKLPERNASFTDDYEKIEGINKNVYKDFYNKKEYKGKENEEKFISYLESQSKVLWWHKQSDNGRSVFAIEYYDTKEKRNRLFYPDFIIKTADKLFIVDTKGGQTAKSQETADKSKGLQIWIENNQHYDFKIIGGIVRESYPNWLINYKEEYIYERSEDWEVLQFK